MIKEIHLAGAYLIAEVLQSNLEPEKRFRQSFPTWFPFSRIEPSLVLRRAGEISASREAALVVINLNDQVWKEVKDSLPSYGRTILVQTEGMIQWETAYQRVDRFDAFVNFDRTYAAHPGFIHAYDPYVPDRVNGHRDGSGLDAMRRQWSFSRGVFLDAYLLRFLPRHRKAALIATINPQTHYQVRVRIASKWKQQVDVFGGGWPNNQITWRGICGSKIDVLRRYRHALVMENQRQPGYFTEKLLDAFRAGAVPIYWGAPDFSELPGAGAIIPVDEVQTSLEDTIRDDADYHRRVKILQRERKNMFDLFSVERYAGALKQAIEG
jgi:hypothetical protein